MKKLGFLFALIAVLAMATGAFAAIHVVRSGVTSMDAAFATPFSLPHDFGVIKVVSGESWSVNFTIRSGDSTNSVDITASYDHQTTEMIAVGGVTWTTLNGGPAGTRGVRFAPTGTKSYGSYKAVFKPTTATLQNPAVEAALTGKTATIVGSYGDTPYSGSSGSSGCTAAYAPFALLLAAPLFFFRKRG